MKYTSNVGAVFSEDKTHRGVLWREWDPTKPAILFIGLNPSTADDKNDDPTIRRVVRFASDWGYGKVYMMNLYSQVTSNPKELILDESEPWVTEWAYEMYAKSCNEVIFAWGNFKEAQAAAKKLIALFPDAMALQINKNGSPKHPLYVKADVQRVKFNLNK